MSDIEATGSRQEDIPQLFFLADQELELSPAEAAAIPRLLGAAALGIAAPRQSGFEVRAAAMNTHGNVVHGGNREYGLSRAYVHGEEAVVSKLLSEYPGVPLLGLGLYAEGDTPDVMLPCPCGNCRDVLLEEASPELLLVCGNERLAVATRLGMYLADRFTEAEVPEVLSDPVIDGASRAAFRALRRGVSVYLPENMKREIYGVTLVDKNNQLFSGSFDTTASYDAITPGVAAIQSFRNRPEATRPLAGLQAIVIAKQSEAAQPAYRDRNALTELDEMLRDDTGQQAATPVYILQVSDEGTPKRVYITDTAAWLPFPFTPQGIGLETAMQAKLQALAQNI